MYREESSDIKPLKYQTTYIVLNLKLQSNLGVKAYGLGESGCLRQVAVLWRVKIEFRQI